VSNSSSSSFIVERGLAKWKESKPLSKETEKKLKKFGFKLLPAYFPFQIQLAKDWKPNKKEGYKYCSWTYEVICNEYEPLDFLLKNRISFIADGPYGQTGFKYDGETDQLVIARNLGVDLHMGQLGLSGRPPQDSVVKTTGTEYRKKL